MGFLSKKHLVLSHQTKNTHSKKPPHFIYSVFIVHAHFCILVPSCALGKDMKSRERDFLYDRMRGNGLKLTEGSLD